MTLKRTETHDQDWEEQVMKVGVEVLQANTLTVCHVTTARPYPSPYPSPWQVFLYMETTVAMFSKGLLAGMSLLALVRPQTLTTADIDMFLLQNASYGRCNESEFTFCYAVTAGHTIRLFYFLMNVCSIVALIQYNQVVSSRTPSARSAE